MHQISRKRSADQGYIGVLDNVSLQDDLARDLREKGAVVLDDQSGFFTEEDWDSLERLGQPSDLLPFETVHIGDAGEPNKVEVGRLMTDVEGPLVVNEAVSKRMLEILGAPSRLKFMENLLGMSPLYVRRAQINSMFTGSFIGVHLDRDSNPDYEVSIVLQFGRAFEGGEFVIHLPDGSKNTIVPRFRSVTITRCDLPHEVRTVQGGTRTSLVYFVSKHSGHNRRYLSSVATGASSTMM